MLSTPSAQLHTLVYQEWHLLWTDQQLLLWDDADETIQVHKKNTPCRNNSKKKKKRKQQPKRTPQQAVEPPVIPTSTVLGTVKEIEPAGSEDTSSQQDDDDDETDTKDPPASLNGMEQEAARVVLETTDRLSRTMMHTDEDENDDNDDNSFQKVERSKPKRGRREPPTEQRMTFRKPRRPKSTMATSPKKSPPRYQKPPMEVYQPQQYIPHLSDAAVAYRSSPSSLPTPDYSSPPRRPIPQEQSHLQPPHFPYLQHQHHHHHGPIYSLQSLPPIDDPTATIRTSNVVSDTMYVEQHDGCDGPSLPTEHFASSSSSGAVIPPSQFYHYYTPWGEAGFHPPFHNNTNNNRTNSNSSTARNESILSELFVGLTTKPTHTTSADADLLSTAASIASSSGVSEHYNMESDDHAETTIGDDGVALVDLVPSTGQGPTGSSSSPMIEPLPDSLPEEAEKLSEVGEEDDVDPALSIDSPSPPSTPSPTLSPVFVSLSEISTMKESIDRLKLPQQQQESFDGSDPGVQVKYSLSSPPLDTAASHDASCSSDPRKHPRQFPSTGGGSARPLRTRDDQEIKFQPLVVHPKPRKSSSSVDAYRGGAAMAKKVGARDDHDIKLRSNNNTNESPPRLTSCRSSVGRSLSKADQKHHYRRSSPRHMCLESSSLVHRKSYGLTASSSETALDGDDYQNWHDTMSKTGDNTQNDGADTIHSTSSQHQFEPPSTSVESLREERNLYQDMCLTLGAEVATLRAQLAAQKAVCSPDVAFPRTAAATTTPDFLAQPQQPHPYYGVAPLQFFPHTFPLAPRAKTLAAMSDTGYRGGEHESLASEDEIASRTKLTNQKSGPFSSAVTLAESDASLDQSSTHNFTHPSLTREFVDEFSSAHQAVRSRLGQDISQLMRLVETQLNRLAPKRQSAIERMTRLVKTQWPRAQVSLYGSHATGLCVPNSDLDFVISLPAVHKKAVAVAPGALEGRNAINETSQKQLARHLKGESWIDPRSMKLIDRTFVPVIKVATKDTKAKTLHLDISFEGPGHHGLEAARMISSVVEEFPVVRPLVIVLKLLLIDRSLLESYSGGLSSYCLFLMVTKYVQEQDRGLDVGAMLMGFLDFHGNHFDPRSTGISVRHGQYFARPNYFVTRYDGESNTAWRTPTTSTTEPPSYLRRNSATGGSRRPKLQSGMHAQSYHSMAPVYAPPQQQDQSSFDSGMPYTFDPLFVEDPLSDGNNVGRNAFRIFQVQRALSDAHRALVAALEWEREEETDEHSIPLLKGLFQNDGAVYDLQVH